MNIPVNTKNAPAPIGPYNQSILAGNTLYVSGQIAIDPLTGMLVLDSIALETEQVLKNLKAIVEEARFSLKQVVKTTIFLSDMKYFEVVNEIYANYFNSKNSPARECVAVKSLPKGVNIEISAIVVS